MFNEKYLLLFNVFLPFFAFINFNFEIELISHFFVQFTIFLHWTNLSTINLFKYFKRWY